MFTRHARPREPLDDLGVRRIAGLGHQRRATPAIGTDGGDRDDLHDDWHEASAPTYNGASDGQSNSVQHVTVPSNRDGSLACYAIATYRPSSSEPCTNTLNPTTPAGKLVPQNSTVLVLVNDADTRDAVRRRLIDIDAIPLIVRADRATAAIERYRPVAAVLDQAHAARASVGFLATTSAHRVRLLTLPDPTLAPEIGDDALREAVSPRRAM